MHFVLRHATSRLAQPVRRHGALRLPSVRWNSTSSLGSVAQKYADKVQKRLDVEGVSSIDELKKKLQPPPPQLPIETLRKLEPDPAAEAKALPSWSASSRQDASPVKPLTDFIDLSRIFATPHSANDVAQIWIAYHAAKTGGTGRGFVAAVVPVAAYEQLLASASQFAAFVLPLKRAGTLADSSSSDQGGHEFYYLEWAQYDAPRRLDSVGTEGKANPRISTAIFTSLAEYKLRQDFAQPHLALTFHTELARSHGLVLMRGELTPSIAGADSFLLTQEDAQTLCVLMQKFYLPTMQNDARCNLLRTFHTHPAEFKWEELVEQSALY